MVSMNTNRPEIRKLKHESIDRLPSHAAAYPTSRAPSAYVMTTVRIAESAGTSRADASEIPNALKLVAVSQYRSGGLSRYGLPNRVGTTKSPDSSISREISA